MHDPDAPRAGGFTHWVLYNIPPMSLLFSQVCRHNNTSPASEFRERTTQASLAIWGQFLRLYALDAELNLKPGASQEQAQQAMRGHVLEQTELMGTYANTSERAA
jgi:phosphatidylethanolamine-binding protein (PEBP) family uncharacterized protein